MKWNKNNFNIHLSGCLKPALSTENYLPHFTKLWYLLKQVIPGMLPINTPAFRKNDYAPTSQFQRSKCSHDDDRSKIWRTGITQLLSLILCLLSHQYQAISVKGAALLLSRYQEWSCSGLKRFRRIRANGVLDLGRNKYSEMTPWSSLLPPQELDFIFPRDTKLWFCSDSPFSVSV